MRTVTIRPTATTITDVCTKAKQSKRQAVNNRLYSLNLYKYKCIDKYVSLPRLGN